MKNLMMTWFAAMFLAFTLTACGLQEPTDDSPAANLQPDGTGTVLVTDAGLPDADAGTPDADAGQPVADAGTPAPALDDGPFRSPAACVFDFSSKYVSGSTCGEVRGNATNMSWTSGPKILDADRDGYMGMSFHMDPGTYELSYLGFQDCATSTPNQAWAQYGGEDQLRAMTSAGRAFIQCNWWDATAKAKVTVGNPSCSLRITVDGKCSVTAAGNMANFQ